MLTCSLSLLSANGGDDTLKGANALWSNELGDDSEEGGINVKTPKGFHHVTPLTVKQFTDSDWVPYGYTLGGPSHSSVGAENAAPYEGRR